MLLEVGIIVAGIPVGWLLRKQRQAQVAANRLLMWTVWILLFLLGMALGGNKELIAQFDSLGVRAIVICVFSIAGSLLAARLLGKYLRLEAPEEPHGGPEGDSRPGGKL